MNKTERRKYLTDKKKRAQAIQARWEVLEDLGMVRCGYKPDESQYDDSYLECQGRTAAQVEKARTELWETIEREGVWGFVAEYRTGPNHTWQHGDSIWGLIGQDAHVYEPDVKQDCMAELTREFHSEE